ncbi:ribonuclease PH [Actinomyces sp. zg-332]|nr:ribonuclease PH [Actinomyces sp. zg-332]
MRADGRTCNQMRNVSIETGWSINPEGSVLISVGDTKVLCNASFTQGVPNWLKGSGKGWVTAEYAMLPRATSTRNNRESVKGKLSGRTQEISRLIGRSLRSIVDMSKLGENTIIIDCDVLQADGGTRTASITGAYVALEIAVRYGIKNGFINANSVKEVLKDTVSAVSVGIYNELPCIDLCYIEDSQAQTDMNVVLSGNGDIIEVQATAEKEPLSRKELNDLLDLAENGAKELQELQVESLNYE